MASVVESITRLNITGNVIPNVWWSRITMPNGKPDCNAVVLLSEIIYWYRGREIRDEATGAVVRLEKRFHADKLQRSYQSFADQFGFTKRQVQEAMHRLERSGLVDLELRTITGSKGSAVSIVLFIEPVAEKVAQITFGNPSEGGTPESDSYDVTTGELSHYNVIAITPERGTYTETTTETTTKNKTPPTPQGGQPACAGLPDAGSKKKSTVVDYQAVVDAYNDVLGDRLPKCKALNDKRRRAIKRLLSELSEPTAEAAARYFRSFAKRARPFHFGENDRDWRADFDYVIRSETLLKTREEAL